MCVVCALCVSVLWHSRTSALSHLADTALPTPARSHTGSHWPTAPCVPRCTTSAFCVVPHWVWCGVVWCGVVWCGVCHVASFRVVSCHVSCVVRRVLCHVVSCRVVSCRVVWCHAVTCCVVLCCVVSCCIVVVSCGFTPRHATKSSQSTVIENSLGHFVVLCRVISCCVVSCHVVSCRCCVVLCCVVLCCVVSCCVVLCCVVLCCAVLCAVKDMSCCVVFHTTTHRTHTHTLGTTKQEQSKKSG